MITTSRFLAEWFGDANRLTLAHVAQRQRLGRLVDRFDEALAQPSILPRMRESGETVEWYLLAGNDDDFRRALGEVRGAVGPTYARWHDPLVDLRLADPLDAVAAGLTAGRAAKFVTRTRDEFDAIWPPLERLLALWDARPVRAYRLRRPVAVVVRDIDLALHAGATDTVRRDVRELRSRGAISTQNARFTEVRALAAEGRWAEIVESPYFADLCRVRRPWTLSEILARGAHEVLFREPFERRDREAALVAYDSRREDLDSLLRIRGPARDVNALLAYAVHAAVRDEPRSVFDELAATMAVPAAREWIEILAGKSTDRRPSLDLTAEQALAAADFQAALRIARAGETAEDARVALVAAYELGSLDAAQAAMAFWGSLDSAVRDTATERRVARDALAEIRVLADGTHEVSSWEDWLEKVSGDPEWASASAVARSGELEFAAIDELRPDSADRMAIAVQALVESDARGVLLDALPSMLGWLAAQEATPSVTTPLYLAVLEALALTEGWEAGTLEVSGDLVDRLMAAGLTPARYSDVLDLVDVIWTSMASRRSVGWFADLMELLEASPGDVDRLRATFASGLALLGDPQSISRLAVEGLRFVAGRLGLGDLLPAIPDAPGAQVEAEFDLAGKKIGIYSLTPQALVRARERVLARYPGVVIETNGDYVATPALTELARSADLMVVALGSAKHAATDAISASRAEGAPTLRGAFKGSTRIVEAIVAAVEDEGKLS